jgi:hypothetical protein
MFIGRQGNRHRLTTALIALGISAAAARILVLLLRWVLAATSVLATLLCGALFLLPGPVAPALLLTTLSAPALFAALAGLLLTAFLLLTALMIVLVHEFLLCEINLSKTPNGSARSELGPTCKMFVRDEKLTSDSHWPASRNWMPWRAVGRKRDHAMTMLNPEAPAGSCLPNDFAEPNKRLPYRRRLQR